jgi:pyrroline-5-carboxylate reductase
VPYYRTMENLNAQIAILGCGTIGTAIASGLVTSGLCRPEQISATRRDKERLTALSEAGFAAGCDNRAAVREAAIIILTVTPQHLDELLGEIKPEIRPRQHTILSVVSGASIKQIRGHLGQEIPIVRVMPNTAIAIRESMTCLSADDRDVEALNLARRIFDCLGRSLVIHEDLMVPATALCACGVAFFLRAVRAASQGGIEIGFHSEDALFMAAQTAKGAAAILLEGGKHPEREVDKVTTPQGCTISGLNQMEHHGFSSSLIRGILVAAEKAATLYTRPE